MHNKEAGGQLKEGMRIELHVIFFLQWNVRPLHKKRTELRSEKTAKIMDTAFSYIAE